MRPDGDLTVTEYERFDAMARDITPIDDILDALGVDPRTLSARAADDVRHIWCMAVGETSAELHAIAHRLSKGGSHSAVKFLMQRATGLSETQQGLGHAAGMRGGKRPQPFQPNPLLPDVVTSIDTALRKQLAHANRVWRADREGY